MGGKSGIVAITMVGLVALAVYSAAGRRGELTSATVAAAPSSCPTGRQLPAICIP